MEKAWPKDFGKVYVEPEKVIWNSAQCEECVDLRECLREKATLEYKLRMALEDIAQLQLEKRWLAEDLLQYTRGITDFTENTDEN